MKKITSRQWFWINIAVSAIAVLFLFWIVYGQGGVANGSELKVIAEQKGWVGFLPSVNASLNSLSTLFLIMGFVAIKSGHLTIHKTCMNGAMFASALFLVSYITYHTLHGDTPFLGQGPVRFIYFSILISHIVLSIVALPMVLGTYALAVKGYTEKHKSWAKWTFPIWLYVSVTGVLIFFMLKNFSP
jgi:putative membrane protein